MATVETLQNLRLITRLYFRVLRWRIQNEYFKEYAKFYMVREELQALGVRTVKELKLFDEGSWAEYISRVKWDQEQFGQKGILYREDLFRQREVGDLEHIPGKAEVNRIYFKNPGPIPEISIVEQLQELRIDIESNISGDILTMCKWPGLPLFEQCKNSNDVIQLINSKRQNPKDVLKKMIYVQGNYLSCFRMLKRVVKHKTQQIPETTSSSGNAGGKKKPEKKLKPLPKGFSFGKGQAFFKNRDLELPTGAEVNSVEILKKLVKSFGKVVLYKNLDENSADTASDFLRGKIRTINLALKKHKVPCRIQSKKWVGYVLSNSRRHY